MIIRTVRLCSNRVTAKNGAACVREASEDPPADGWEVSRVGSMCPSVQSVSLHIKTRNPEFPGVVCSLLSSTHGHPQPLCSATLTAPRRFHLAPHTARSLVPSPVFSNRRIQPRLNPSKGSKVFMPPRIMLLFVNKNKTLSQGFFTKRGRPVLCQMRCLHVLKSV